MLEFIPNSFEARAVLGDRAKEIFSKRVDQAAKTIHEGNILNPKTEADRRSVDARAIHLVKTLGGDTEFRSDSVQGLINTLKDDQKTEQQKRIAEERLDILGKSVFMVMRYGGDTNLQDLLGKASAGEIENILPTPLKGLGERIVKNLITNGEILSILRDLDDVRTNCDLTVPTDRVVLIEEMSAGYQKLIRLKGLNADEKDQLRMVRVYLNSEMQFLSEKIQRDVEKGGTDDSKDSGEVNLRGEITIPKEVEKQEQLARQLLDLIEFRQLDPWSLEASEYKRILDFMRQSDEVEAGIKQEIITRMRLQLISGVMAAAGGWLGERTPASISAMLNKADGEGGLFDVKDMRFLLKGKDGLSVAIAAAWNEFQKINIGKGVGRVGADGKRIEWGGYHDVLLEIFEDENEEFRKKHGLSDSERDVFVSGGTNPVFEDYLDKEGMWADAYDNYFSDANLRRKEIVRDFIAEKITRLQGANKVQLSGYEAHKGVELAWNLMVASGETSVFNPIFAGHNDLSELILTKFDTLDRMYKGKPIGAFTCLQYIVSLSPTWLRYMSDRTVFGVLNAEDVDVDKMEGTTKYAIDYWYSSMITQKISELKAAMRSEDASPKELCNPPTLKKIGEWISKAAKFPSVILGSDRKPILDLTSDTVDSEGRPLKVTKKAQERREKRMRFLMVAGWAEQAMSNIDLGWDTPTWKYFRDILTREYIFDESKPNEKRSFISSSDLDIIERKILNKFLGSYRELDKLNQIRVARKNGVHSFRRANPKTFEI